MNHAIYACTLGELADVRELARLAAAAEEAGYEGFFISDWMLPSTWPHDRPTAVADTQVALAAIALATHRIRFGAMVSPLPRRRPVKFAREAVSLDRMSGGRLVIGAGSGHEAVTEFEQLGEAAEPRVRADRLDEALQVVDGLLRGEAVDVTGRYVTVRRTQLADPILQEPRIPIWLGASPRHPRPLRRAARYEGVFLLPADFSLLSPGDVEVARDYLLANGAAGDPYDIAVAARFPDNYPAPTPEVMTEYERAGATWWLEYAWTPGQAHALIERGRPQTGVAGRP